MAKEINTRIQLKHDSLAAWNSSTIALKYGEAAVAFVDTATTDTHGNIIHVPTALLKFGDATGTKTFKDLPFASALAADVYSWAKAYTVALNGKNLEFQKADGGVVHSVALNFLTQEDANTLLANYYNKTEIDGKIEAINKTITDLDVSALEGRVDDLEIAVNTTIPGQINALDTKFENYTPAANQSATDGEQDRRIGVLEADLAGKVNSGDFQAYKATTNEALADRYTKAEADGKFALIADAYDDTEVRGLISNNTDAITEEKERAEGIEGGLRTDVDAVTARVEAFLDNTGAATEAIDTLQELLTYIAEHDDVEIADIIADVQALENKLAGIDTTVVAYVTAAIDALKIGDYAKASDLADLAARVKDLEDNKAGYATTSEVATAKQEAIDAAVTSAAGLYQPKGDYATAEQGAKADNAAAAIATYGDIVTHNVAEFATNAENGAKALAEAALPKATAEADYVKKADATGYGDILTKTEAGTTYRKVADKITSDDLSDEVFVFNCGTASTVI